MKKSQAIILSVCGVILLALALYYFVDWSPSPDALAKKVLSASDPELRKQAIIALLMMKGRPTLKQVRRVAAESQDPEVMATAMNGLFGDGPSIDLFLDNMNNDSEAVREVAYHGALLFYGGGKLPENIEYDATADSADRLKAIQRLKKNLADSRKQAEIDQKKWDAELATPKK